uniref:DUF4175 domain-containing protein n=1 Tax=Roseobacter sp. HKCCA0434 TaxID=3079297 RepID=UPI002905D852
RPPRPDLRVARQDPLALRLAVVVAFVTALIFGQGAWWPRLTGAIGTAEAAGPTFEAWATPPAYTGQPVIYLTERADQERPLRLPQGTEIALRAYGTGFALEQDVTDAAALSDSGEGLADARLTLDRNGSLALTRRGRTLATWRFVVEGDQVPTVAFDGEIGRAEAGATRIGYLAEDDFAVATLRVVAELDVDAVDRRYGLEPEPMPRDPLVAEIPLPRGAGASVRDVVTQDFSTHPFAALPVRLRLEVVDGAGQTGRSEALAMDLPRRSFFDPLSRAVVEMRRDMLWAPAANAARSARILRAVSYAPEEYEVPEGVFEAMGAAIALIETARANDEVVDQLDGIAAALWDVALMIEDGELADAAAALRRAQERLSQAMQDGASPEEIAELMQDLREAMRDFMREMAEQMQNDPEAQQRAEEQMGESMEMSQQDLQDLMDRIQELTEQGRMEEAQRLLDQLAQLMENMTMSMNGQGQGEGMPGQEGEGEGQGSAQEGVEDGLRQQQDLADRSFEELQRQFREGFGNGEGLQGLADTQEALRELLEDLEQREGLGEGETGEALDRAQRDMGEARDALRDGDGRRALDEQAEAMDALREALRAIENRPGEEGEPRPGEQSAEEGGEGESEDPLGRPTSNGSTLRSEGETVPDGGSIGSVADLMAEIRRRSGDRARPEAEREYYRRLLERF